MKRLKRNPGKFEVIDLYTSLGREHGFKLSEEKHAKDFLELVNSSLKISFEDKRLLYGKRVEAMFAHVAGALGHCKMIKQEDTGQIFTDDDNLQPPDYLIVLKTGERFFVEVKNCHFPNYKSPYPISNDYIEKLENYAKLNEAPLKFAIYFSQFNKWSLLSKESLAEHKHKRSITFVESIAKSEMLTLGDRTIGTKAPLSMLFVADETKDAKITENDEASFTIADIKFHCDGQEVIDHIEKNIAFYLMQFGRWPESDGSAIFENEQLIGVQYDYEPEHNEDQKTQGFTIVGDLSSMVSTAYKWHTIYDQRVIALDVKDDPDVFKVTIPEGYKGDKLPLWQLLIQPNTDFTMDMKT